MRRWLTLLTACMASTSVFAGDQCATSSSHSNVQLVELYTSEGCSSCPPADRWLSALPANSQLIPLAFHVDYWNYLGWRDRFSDARFTQRQRGVGAYNRQSTIYTPEIVVNGKEHRQWHRGLSASQAKVQGFPFAVEAALNDGQVTASINSDKNWPKNARAFIAVTENNLITEVERGENRGRQLHHDHVVRAFEGPFHPDQAFSAKLPGDVITDNAALVVWLEDTHTGQTIEASTLPLSQCASS